MMAERSQVGGDGIPRATAEIEDRPWVRKRLQQQREVFYFPRIKMRPTGIELSAI
jgi:hypothetical protein